MMVEEVDWLAQPMSCSTACEYTVLSRGETSRRSKVAGGGEKVPLLCNLSSVTLSTFQRLRNVVEEIDAVWCEKDRLGYVDGYKVSCC